MAIEIERKFLLKDDSWKSDVVKQKRITQWYISNETNVVRVRIVDDEAFVTIKSNNSGISRLEFEYAIPLNDAKSLRMLSVTPLIEKVRNIAFYKGNMWEVDEFKGNNEGLVIAEVELKDDMIHVDLPDWIDIEVTDDMKYRNSSLVTYPYKHWK